MNLLLHVGCFAFVLIFYYGGGGGVVVVKVNSFKY